MKKPIYILWAFALLNFSCEFEPVGGVIVESQEIRGFTGLTCFGSGEYNYEADNLLRDLVVPDDLPDSHDLSSHLPPVRNQGKQASCVSWAVTYYLKSLQEKIESQLPYTESTIMSPAYTYNQITMGNCTGTSINATLNILKEKGAPSIEVFPYSEGDCSRQPSQSEDEIASNAKIRDYKSLSGENMVFEMKTLIHDEKPIIIGAYLSSQFALKDSFGLSAYREHLVNYGNVDSCHAMLVIGYSDTYNAFKAVNSWGSDWGDDGFVWIDYKAFDNVLDDKASFKVINQAYVAYDF